MSDRREDLTTANVECYIYNNITSVPDTITTSSTTGIDIPILPIITTGTSLQTGTLSTEVHNTDAGQTTPSTDITPKPIDVPTPITPTVPVIVTPPSVPVVVPQGSINQKLSLTSDNLSDIAQHFLTQNDITFTLVSKTPLLLGEVATLTLEIKNKDGQT